MAGVPGGGGGDEPPSHPGFFGTRHGSTSLRVGAATLWLALPLPGLNVVDRWFEGQLLYQRRTTAVTESVTLFLLLLTVTLIVGMIDGSKPGIFVAVSGFVIGFISRTFWLRLRWQRLVDEGLQH